MISKYANKIYLKKDLYAIYNNLIMDPIFTTEKEMKSIFNNDLKDFNEKQINKLYDKCILVDNKLQDQKALNVVKNIIENNTFEKITMMYIIPNNNCNLKCKYCFIGQLKDDPIYMSEKTAYNAISKFVSHLKKIHAKKGSIIFYGGEPLINFDIIKYSTNLIKSLNFPIDISIVSNSILLDKEKALFIKENNIALGISIDGPKSINDENRIFKFSNDSVYDNVIQKLRMLKENDVKFGLSITLSENSINNKTMFINWIKNNDFKDINYNPLHFSNANDNWKEYYKKVGNFIFDCNTALYPLGVREDRIARKYKSFYEKDFKYSDCGAKGGNQITIRPNGDVTICHGYWNIKNNEIGNINEIEFYDIFQSNFYKEWHKNLTINNIKCLNCNALFVCGGGCSMQSEDLFGTINEIDKPFCKYTKSILKSILLDLYENTKKTSI